MAIGLRPLGDGFAAEVVDVDAGRPLGGAVVDAVEGAMARYGVLVFRNQPIDDSQQLEFTRNFGPLLDGANTTRAGSLRLDPAFADVSNVDEHGQLLPRNDRRRDFSLGNRLWHTDASFRQVPARFSVLSARVVPPAGGNTEFADMRAAYDELSGAEAADVEPLLAEHSLIYSRSLLGFEDYSDDERSEMAAVRHPLVRRHPVTGRRSLYLSAHIGSIVGWSRPESMVLLFDLMERATSSDKVYVHEWGAGDLVMWDNRQTMHRGRAFEDTRFCRDLRRTTTVMFEPSDLALCPH